MGYYLQGVALGYQIVPRWGFVSHHIPRPNGA